MYPVEGRATEIGPADLYPQPRSDLNHLCWPWEG